MTPVSNKIYYQQVVFNTQMEKQLEIFVNKDKFNFENFDSIKDYTKVIDEMADVLLLDGIKELNKTLENLPNDGESIKELFNRFHGTTVRTIGSQFLERLSEATDEIHIQKLKVLQLEDEVDKLRKQIDDMNYLF